MTRAALAVIACAVVALWAPSGGAVVGGTLDSGDPAVVLLTLGGLPYCTGSLIGNRTILTAGHCAADLGIAINAVVGTDITNPSNTFDIVDTAQHPSFSGEGNDFDVALFRIDRDANVTPLALSTHALVDGDVGANLRHVGFGVSDEASGDGRGTKRTVDYPITRVSSTMVYSFADGKQTCDGDSGGPAFFIDDDGVERIIGVVSDGPSCHEEGWDVRVDSVRPFIDDTLARFEDVHDDAAPSCGCRSREPSSSAAALLVFAAFLRAFARARPNGRGESSST